jgi:putative NADH-flavin reductase
MVESKKEQSGLRVAIIGASGAIGKEIVDHLKKDSRFSEVILLVRKQLDEWKPDDFIPKLTVILKENFDSFEDVKDHLVGVDAFLCTLGTRVKVGDELFIKVDY